MTRQALRLAWALALAACASKHEPAPTGAPDLALVDAAPGGWTTRRPLPSARQETAVAALGGLVYVVGGFDASFAVVTDVDAYDPATDEWMRRAPLPRPMHHANLAAVDGALWVVGQLVSEGGDAFAAAGQILRYSPAADAWEARGELPAGQARGASFVAVLDGRIYVAGGLRGGIAVADCAAYATATGQWRSCAPLPTARDHGVGAALGSSFYAVGGRGGAISAHTTRVDAYDPATDRWSERAPMPTSRAGMSGATVSGRLLVAGGEGAATPSGVFSEVELYDPSADAWSTLPPMKTPRHGTGAAAVDDTVYVPGGATVQAFGAVNTHEALRP